MAVGKVAPGYACFILRAPAAAAERAYVLHYKERKVVLFQKQQYPLNPFSGQWHEPTGLIYVIAL